jgi:hypothetical protein
MCAAAGPLQEWWREPPTERPNAGARPLHSNVMFGDFFHHGKEADDRRPVQQVSVIISKVVVVGIGVTPHFAVHVGHDVGGHKPTQLHRQAGHQTDGLSIIESGWAVWLPRLDQLLRLVRDHGEHESHERLFLLLAAMSATHPGSSAEQAALRVYMAECHGRPRWDGREWGEAL